MTTQIASLGDKFGAAPPPKGIEIEGPVTECSFSDQMPKFFISFDEVNQLGV
jgi:hypothetical protein